MADRKMGISLSESSGILISMKVGQVLKLLHNDGWFRVPSRGASQTGGVEIAREKNEALRDCSGKSKVELCSVRPRLARLCGDWHHCQGDSLNDSMRRS
jgi:hypothetical protein